MYRFHALVVIFAQFTHIFGQDNNSVLMSFRFKDIHRPIKQVDIFSSEPSGFYRSETAAVNHSEYYRYYLCLDNDEAGEDACDGMLDTLEDMGYDVERLRPEGKDWNDDLRAKRGKAKTPTA